jgi:Na+-translocating ferredoxin:NAD+ oxidoreductase RnfD subunit
VFGAVYGQFALRGWKYAPVALILAVIMLLLKWPAYVVIPVTLIGTILFGRLIYKPGKTIAPEGEGKP